MTTIKSKAEAERWVEAARKRVADVREEHQRELERAQMEIDEAEAALRNALAREAPLAGPFFEVVHRNASPLRYVPRALLRPAGPPAAGDAWRAQAAALLRAAAELYLDGDASGDAIVADLDGFTAHVRLEGTDAAPTTIARLRARLRAAADKLGLALTPASRAPVTP